VEKISGSVGHKGINKYLDVSLIQTMLNDTNLSPMTLLNIDGKCGKATIAQIKEFQHRCINMLNPDGRVDPHGGTLRKLDQLQPKTPTPNNFSAIASFMKPKQAMCFPLASRPTQSYKLGMRKFGANRKNKRKHAGADLYAPVGTAIYAMDDGEIINGPYAFYLGTQAVEIQHTNFLARYGEIKSVATGLKKGSKVKRGQLIAYVGELRGLNMSMLHLELYKGNKTGALTVRANKPYQRRADIFDPSSILDKAKCK